jgi:hypothetical protein
MEGVTELRLVTALKGPANEVFVKRSILYDPHCRPFLRETALKHRWLLGGAFNSLFIKELFSVIFCAKDKKSFPDGYLACFSGGNPHTYPQILWISRSLFAAWSKA